MHVNAVLRVFLPAFQIRFQERFYRRVLHMRNDSLFKAFPYEVVRIIIMDNAGAWSLFCELWNEIRDDLGIYCLYVPEDNDKDASMAEVACKTMESMVKKLLIRRGLLAARRCRCRRPASSTLGSRLASSASAAAAPMLLCWCPSAGPGGLDHCILQCAGQ